MKKDIKVGYGVDFDAVAGWLGSEEKVLFKTIDILKKVSGKKPVGYVASWWEFSKVTNDWTFALFRLRLF